MTLEAGTRLGHYRIIALLGRGGMADVYRAEDERLGREVALKALPPEFARDPERIERFEREVRAAAKLTHPNIVTVYEYGVGEEHPFYTMALLPGGDLKVRIRAHPDGMPPSEALKVTAAMARALEYAHGQGFVHRDIKPENILFTADGTPQLTDFGIARAMSEGTRMTATGMSIGSPHYMSPEQARGQAVDGRSDLYSLGVVLYEMLTGRVPFDASDTFAVGLSHINDPVPALPGRLSAWQPVVERLLAKSPEDRHGSAGELAEVLSSDAPPQAQPTRLMERPRDVRRAARAKALATWLASLPKPRRGLRAALVGGVLAVVAVGIVYVAMQQGAVGPERQPFNGGGGSATAQPAPVQTAPPSNPANPFDLNSPAIARPPDDGGDPGEATETPVLSPAARPSSVLEGNALLVVETTPPGAEVLVDGTRVGETPLERSDIRAGVWQVTLRHPHYETARIPDQNFEDGVVLRVERVLERGVGRLTVTATPREAWVELDGERLAEDTPVTLENLPAGPLDVRLGASEHRTLAVEVEIPKDGLARLERTLERITYGSLTLELEPPTAQVRLLNHDSGYRAGIELPPGDYRLEVTAAGHETAVLTLRHGSSSTRREVSLRRGVFMEDWARGTIDQSRWVTYGSPSPRIVRGPGGSPGVFDNNGDPNYDSGAVSVRALDLGTEWVSIEADVFLSFSNPSGCWASVQIGLTADPDVSPSSLERGSSHGLKFNLHAEGDACWATPSEYRRRAWFSGGIIRPDGSWEGMPAFGVEGTTYANHWWRLRIVIDTENRVSLDMDDKRLWTSSGTLDPALRSGRKLILGNRSSGSAGRAYIDNIEVWSYRGPRAVDQ